MTRRIGIAGLGTVGCGLLSILTGDDPSARVTGALSVSGVSARTKDRARPEPIDAYQWFDDPVALAESPETDIFVELIGGAEGPARASVEAALRAGKSVVTANKALIAAHGQDLAKLAEAHGAALKFEAAVAGGTPVVRGVGGALSACRIVSMAGILNGTCNFVLDQMAQHGASYDAAVKEAQEVGFAESDPSLDVDGVDAAQKISILSMLAYDGTVSEKDFSVRGISRITTDDIAMAAQYDFAIKLIAEARCAGEEGVALRVSPAFVPDWHPFAAAEGAGNALAVTADPLGGLLFTGPGAGGGATASAVASDLMDIARGAPGPVFMVPAAELTPLSLASSDTFLDPYALRVAVSDPAHSADSLSQTLVAAGIPISFIEPGEDHIAVVTEEVTEDRLAQVSAELTKSGFAKSATYFPILAP